MARKKPAKNKKGERDLDFLFELGSLRHVPRGWRQHLGRDCASVLEHTVRVAWLSLVLARKEGVKNEEKVLKMALVHDISETRTSDHSYVQKVYVQENESGAARDMFSSTSLSDFESEILEEFVKRKSPEAHVVKDADNLDIDLELKELEAIGSQVVPKWRAFRRKVRDEKLYTKSARELWDLIQDADPDRWHLEINKWVRHPNAGK